MPEGASGLLSRWVKSRRHRRVLPYLKSGDRVVDVGCGLGELCARLPAGIQFTGLDREPEFIARCRLRYPGHTFLEGDFFDLLPGLPRDLDGVLLLAVLEHSPVPEALFRAVRDLLKPGGWLLVTTPPPHSALWHFLGVRLGLLSPMAGKDHQALLDPGRVRSMGLAAGFDLRREERFLCGLNRFFVFAKEKS